MIILRLLILSILSFFLAFCSYKDNKEQIFVDVGETPIEIPLSDLFDTVLIVPLETREEALIGSISKTYTTENHLFVLDKKIAQALFLFDLQGKLIHSFNGTGEGPGEFIRASNFYIAYDRQSVFIQDYSLSKILQFTLDGTFIREKKISAETQFYDLYPVQSGFYAAIPDDSNTGVFLGILEQDLELAGIKIPVDPADKRIEWNMKDQFIYEGFGNNIFFKETLRNTLYHFEPGKPIKTLRFDFGSHNWEPRRSKLNLKEAYNDIWRSGTCALGDQVLDMETMILINYWQGKELKMLSVDKQTHKAQIVKRFVNNIDGYVEGLSGILPSNAGANQLIMDLLPDDYLKIQQKKGSAAYSQRIDEIQVDGLDNPILFIYRKTE